MKGQGIKGPYFRWHSQCFGKPLSQELPLHPSLSQEMVHKSLLQICSGAFVKYRFPYPTP